MKKSAEKLVIGQDYNSTFSCLCIERLSLDLHRSLQKRLISLPVTFFDSFAQGLVFQDVLSKVIAVLGLLCIELLMCQRTCNTQSPILIVFQQILEKARWNKVNESFTLRKSLVSLALTKTGHLF